MAPSGQSVVWQAIEDFKARGAIVSHGCFGENLIVDGIDFAALPVGICHCNEVLMEVSIDRQGMSQPLPDISHTWVTASCPAGRVRQGSARRNCARRCNACAARWGSKLARGGDGETGAVLAARAYAGWAVTGSRCCVGRSF